MTTRPAVEVIVGADVLVGALSRISAAAVQFPAMPPRTADPYADVVGAFVSSDGDFALILTEAIVEQLLTALIHPDGLAWAFDEADRAAATISDLATHCRGGFVEPAWEVQLPPLAPAARTALQAAASKDLDHPRVVVTADSQALALSPWRPRGVPFPPNESITVMSPDTFRNFVERARWHFRASGGPGS